MDLCLKIAIFAAVMRRIRIMLLFAALLLGAGLYAQEKTPEEMEREFYENIQNEVEKCATTYNLEDWQIFYVDSIYVHNFMAMREEMMNLQKAKVENTDLYLIIQDKWAEENYNALQKVFNEEQWARYLKYGARKDKEARDRRAAKRDETTSGKPAKTKSKAKGKI